MIRIQNIYYMLAYAFQILQEKGYRSLGTEEFQNTADLLSAILVKGVSTQIKRGLGRAYVEETDILSCLRGKIDISESVKHQTMTHQKLVCTYDVFSVNSYMNRVLKTTMEILMRSDIPRMRKKELKNLLMYFREVQSLDPYTINWKLRYDRNNQTYRMLISVCYLVLNGLLQKTADGKHKMMDFLDEQRMCRLYEKFILEYYRKEYPEFHAAPSEVKWALDDGFDFMLPSMKTDITLSLPGKMLIIDAKYYSSTTQTQFGVHKLHSGNLYQIFTYVKNAAQKCNHVSGLLLYARTDEEIYPQDVYQMSGNQIGAGVLDLSGGFDQIKARLDNIAKTFIDNMR